MILNTKIGEKNTYLTLRDVHGDERRNCQRMCLQSALESAGEATLHIAATLEELLHEISWENTL